MKISEIRIDYYEASGKVSDIVRQLGFAGIGVIWIIRVGTESGGIRYADSLFYPLFLFVSGLALDLLQYVYKTAYLGVLNTHLWRKHRDNDKDVCVSGKWNWPTIIAFWSKTAAVLTAYILLLRFIFSQLPNNPSP